MKNIVKPGIRIRGQRRLLVAIVLLPLIFGSAPAALASPGFSGQTGLSCTACHENPQGGSVLTSYGARFRANAYSTENLPEKLQWHSLPYLIAGFIHILTAVIWFGTIFYIHLFIRPRSIMGGLPKSEMMLGRICILLVGITGIVLSIWRIPEISILWNTTFGIVWLVKVGAFILMVAIAAFTTTWLNRKLKAGAQQDGESAAPSANNGKEGRPAHVIHHGRIYDVTQSKLWKDGVHMRRHSAGTDLTEAMAGAPHGAEVLERMPDLGEAATESEAGTPWPQQVFLILSYLVLVFMLIILLCVAYWNYGPPLAAYQKDPFRSALAADCMDCHRRSTPAAHAGWAKSAHGRAGVSCLHCHRTTPEDPLAAADHAAHFKKDSPRPTRHVSVSARVSPGDCALCHPIEKNQFARSKHARSLAIISQTGRYQSGAWLEPGMTSPVERRSGCYACHGSDFSRGAAEPAPLTNAAGIGRINPDGSRGSCIPCHSRHRFSIAEARKPEACGPCHVGPAHPQKKIFDESKHGAICRTFGDSFDWRVASAAWTPGVDFRAPTCAVCHMSATQTAGTTHNVSRRLSWELQAPRTVRPKAFAPANPQIGWQQARKEMQSVCRPCHSKSWSKAHFKQLDRVVDTFNTAYYAPAKAQLEELYAKGRLDKSRALDEPLELDFYELWHFAGRQARMGAAMMAPDYTWWHGFYECKQKFNRFMARARQH